MPNPYASRDTRSKKRQRQALNRDLESQGVLSDEVQEMLRQIELEEYYKRLERQAKAHKLKVIKKEETTK